MTFSNGTLWALAAYFGLFVILGIGHLWECYKDNKQRKRSMARSTFNTVQVQYNEESDEHYFDLHQVLENTNVKVSDVEYYEMEDKDGIIILTLYDKNKKQLRLE